MTNTAYVVSVVLLSASTAFAQIPGNREKWTNQATAALLTVSNGEPSAVGIGETQGQYLDQPSPISSAGTYETSNPSPDADSVSESSQSGSVPAKEPGYLHIFVVPGYLWMSGLSGNVGVKNVSLPIDASFKDIFNNLNIGYMGGGDVRYRNLGLLTDVVYIKLTTKEQSTPFGVLYGTARTRAKTFFIEPDVYGVSEGKDVKMLPLRARKGLLSRVFRANGHAQLSQHFGGPLAKFIEGVKKISGEGIVAKRLDAPYQPGRRSGSWSKKRINIGQELVIGGFTPSGNGIDALVVGYYEDGKLMYAARVRAGLVPASRRDLYGFLKPHIIKTCPFANLPESTSGRWGQGLTAAKMKECIWVLCRMRHSNHYAASRNIPHVAIASSICA